MTWLRMNALASLLLMCAAFTAAHVWKPTRHMADARPKVELEAMFPRAFGDWVVDERMPVQLISPDIEATLNKIYNQTLSRTYVNRRGDRVMLSVAYGGDQSDATRAHRPEVCYPAQGFQLVSAEDGQIDTGAQTLRIRRLVARLGGRVEPISYWIVVGDRIALSGTEQKMAQLSYSTRGVIPDGMLVRVSTIDPQSDRAFAVHRTFVTQMTGAIRGEFLTQIVGASRAI